MACHRSNHHLHSHHQPSYCCCCCCCCCASSCCQSSPHPAIPTTTTTTASDPLLQAIAAHLLQSPPAVPGAAYHIYNQQYPKPRYHNPQGQQQPPPPQQKYYHHQPQPQAQSLVQSLLGRIAALESALPHLSSPHPPPAATTPEPPRRKPQPSPPMPPRNPRITIRDLAARTIQARFRLHLVRRSQVLRHLKHLAAVRSHVAAIKSSLSDDARLSPEALSQKATDLLLQLDSIQSTDPMIREGKRTISRELVRLLDLADGVSARRRELSMETAHKVMDPAAFSEQSIPGVDEHFGDISTASAEDEESSDPGSPRMCASASKTAKRVSFAEDGKAASWASTPTGVPFTEGRGAVGRVADDRRRPSTREPSWWRVDEGAGGFFSRVAEHGVDHARWEGGSRGRSRHTSDEERSPRGGQKTGAIGPAATSSPSGQKKASNSLGLSAPLPLQMEPRRGASEEENAVVF